MDTAYATSDCRSAIERTKTRWDVVGDYSANGRKFIPCLIRD